MKDILKEACELLKELMLIGLIVALAVLWTKANQTPTRVILVDQAKQARW